MCQSETVTCTSSTGSEGLWQVLNSLATGSYHQRNFRSPCLEGCSKKQETLLASGMSGERAFLFSGSLEKCPSRASGANRTSKLINERQGKEISDVYDVDQNSGHNVLREAI